MVQKRDKFVRATVAMANEFLQRLIIEAATACKVKLNHLEYFSTELLGLDSSIGKFLHLIIPLCTHTMVGKPGDRLEDFRA